MYYCGWDGGGSKTEICIIDEQCTVVAEATFGPLNPNGASVEIINATVKDCINFMNSVMTDLNNCKGLVVGLAGISNKNTATTVENIIRNCGYHGKLKFLGDHEIALAGAINGQGAILIAGTGSICLCRNEKGQLFRCGGYGHIIDDEGSGYAIGRDILKAVTYAFDGRGEKTILTETVFKQLKISDHDSLVSWLYSENTYKKDIAALAPLLIEAISKGDQSAIKIAQNSDEKLAFLVISAFKKANMSYGEIALMGSIFKYYDYIRFTTTEILKKELPDVQIIEPHHKASFGAANLAKEICNP